LAAGDPLLIDDLDGFAAELVDLRLQRGDFLLRCVGVGLIAVATCFGVAAYVLINASTWPLFSPAAFARRGADRCHRLEAVVAFWTLPCLLPHRGRMRV